MTMSHEDLLYCVLEWKLGTAFKFQLAEVIPLQCLDYLR